MKRNSREGIVRMLFLLLVGVFPPVEKLRHELMHRHEDLCSGQALHYCGREHHCQVCDYVLTTGTSPPGKTDISGLLCLSRENNKFMAVWHMCRDSKYTFRLRGPPGTVERGYPG